MKFLDIFFIILITLIIYAWILIIKTKNEINRNQKLFEENNIHPDYSHGFMLNKNNEIVESKRETISWITKLIK